MSDKEDVFVKEKTQPKISIVDRRETTITQVNQAEALRNELGAYRILEKWEDASKLLGGYGPDQQVEALSISLIDGVMGEGEIVGSDIRLQFPTEAEGIKLLQEGFALYDIELTAEQCKQLLYILETQVCFHEGVHALLNSRPGSAFSAELEARGFSNDNNYHATLLDEGITYAIQDIFAPHFEGIGALTARVNEEDIDLPSKRKKLGKKLAPLISRYLTDNKKLDSEFFDQAADYLKDLN